MKHPTKQQVQVVIDNLKKVKELANGEAKVNMSEGKVYEPSCGSPMCHGGWYAAATLTIDDSNFKSGANKLSNDLGFTDNLQLKLWGDYNPTIWGNEDGYLMFASGVAFGVLDITDLQVIIDHWIGVQSRLPE